MGVAGVHLHMHARLIVFLLGRSLQNDETSTRLFELLNSY